MSLFSHLKQWLALSVVVLTVYGCASLPIFKVTPTRLPTASLTASRPDAPATSTTPSGFAASPVRPALKIPRAPLAEPLSPKEHEATSEQIEALFPANSEVDVTLVPQPLPQLLNSALGDVLKVPFALGPNVASRTDIVTIRSGPRLGERAFLGLLQTALKDYGLRLYIRSGSVAVLEDADPQSATATVLRSRSAADTPDGSRTVIQFFQLQTLEAGAVQPLLQSLLPPTRAVKITVDVQNNILVISGAGRDVQAAVQVLIEIDRPMFSGAEVMRLQPVYWTADAFSKSLEDALTIEGYKISRTPIIARSIMLLSLSSTNQVLVFATDARAMDRVRFWANELDQPGAVGEQKTTFVYAVRNTDAQTLGGLVTGRAAEASTVKAPMGVAGTPTVDAQATTNRQNIGSEFVSSGGSLTIDPVGNRILFTGSAQQFAQIRRLLDQLDIPPLQVMIEVTVAEVTLNDTTQAGLEWFYSRSQGSHTYSGGTRGGLGIKTSGLLINVTGTDLRAAFNAFASNSKVNILSRPRLVTRSGAEAQIQVGTDIPIVTSQGASGVQTGGSTSVLQSIQYRQTGVILKIKPIVYGDNRIDLEISQEVSNSTDSGNAAIASPAILNRSVTTKLSLTEGATSVIGGLISDQFSKGNSGIPFIKDVPLVGQAFRTDTITGVKTELVLLVTPFIIRDGDEMSDLAGKLSGEINDAFRVGRGGSYTLTPLATGLSLGLNLPSPRPAPAAQAVPHKRAATVAEVPTKVGPPPVNPDVATPVAQP